MARRNEEDEVARLYAKKAAKKYKSGTYTASQTGARQLAASRYALAQNREIMNAAAGDTGELEERAIKKEPRPTRKKRY